MFAIVCLIFQQRRPPRSGLLYRTPIHCVESVTEEHLSAIASSAAAKQKDDEQNRNGNAKQPEQDVSSGCHFLDFVV